MYFLMGIIPVAGEEQTSKKCTFCALLRANYSTMQTIGYKLLFQEYTLDLNQSLTVNTSKVFVCHKAAAVQEIKPSLDLRSFILKLSQ